jgi:AcrR family transcriptional regulator
MPRLWTQTIDAHRQQVRCAILDTTAALVQEHGLLSVTMSQIADATGIGRATLYKYFADVEAILFAWHEDQIAKHLERLEGVRDRASTHRERLEGVLETYAHIVSESLGRHNAEFAAFLHRDAHVAEAEGHLRGLVRDILAEGVATGEVRDGVAVDELASYCLFALSAARSLHSKAAVKRLVSVTLAGLRPDR